ncbi:hypothetical protein J3Q00_11380 [Pseudomonas sp. D2-3]
MDFLEAIKQGYDSGYSIYVVAGVVGVAFAKAITTFGQALELHDKNFVRKRLERLENMRTNVPAEHSLARYLDESISQEKFRISSGVSVSQAKAEWLMNLAATGFWQRTHLKAASKFLITDTRSLTTGLEFSWFDRVGAALSCIMGLLLLLLGTLYFLMLYLSLGQLGFFLGAALFCCFVIVGRLFSADFLNYRTAKKIQFYLANHPLPQRAEQ